MRRVSLLLLAALMLPPALVLGRAYGAENDSYLDATVAGWRSDPVYLSPESGALSSAEAAALGDRIDGWRDDVHVAVLPAVALGGDHSAEAAMAFLDRLADAWHRQGGGAGVILVSFSGVGTYAAAYDPVRAGDDEVGAMMAKAVRDHTRGQQYQILDSVLSELGAPGRPAGGSGVGGSGVGGWLVALLILGGLVVVAGIVTLLVVVLRRGSRRRPSGEIWAGAAPYSPSYATFRDESDTREERVGLAREDVTRLGEELDAADLSTTDPIVAEHVHAALDAYAEAGRQVDSLTRVAGGAASEESLREIGRVAEYARWRLASARAQLTGAPPPPRRVPCFLDPDHGVSVADVAWAPPGGVVRAIPVCRACYDRLTTESSGGAR